MNNLPTPEQIQSWSLNKLEQVIASGEAINWQCGAGETQQEIDDYVESLYSERDSRQEDVFIGPEDVVLTDLLAEFDDRNFIEEDYPMDAGITDLESGLL